MTEHKHKEGIEVLVECDNIPAQVGTILARPTTVCSKGHPTYAVEIGGDHWVVCEITLTPIGRRN